MRKQSVELSLGKRLKCGEVFVWNYDSFACAVECTLCEDRPSCSLEDFFEHIQIWHQDDWNINESEKFESEHDSALTDCECEADAETETETETDFEVEAKLSNQTSANIQPFEEVLIEIDGNEENEFDFSNEDNYSDYDCSSTERKQCSQLTGAGLSIDDLAFDNLNIQCAEIDTTNTTFENDFEKWCRRQHRLKDIELKRTHSEDSGVDRSETSSIIVSPTSPAQSISEEDSHFRIDETNIKEQIFFGSNKPLPKPKLTTANMEKLIEIYQQHPNLWQPTHHEHNNATKCRQSWQEIKHEWNKFCKTNLSDLDIRIRLSTLKQRYLKERERREMYKENSDIGPRTYQIPNRFRYYEKLKFLDEQEVEPYTLQGTQIGREYSKLIETYARFPILWDKTNKAHKSSELRQQAYESISKALQLKGIHLPIETVRLRLSTLKRRYRLTKIQSLKSRLKGRSFVSDFKHFEEMKYLDKHVAPYVCDVCRKIFRLFNEYQRHLERENHNLNNDTDNEIIEKYTEKTEPISTSTEAVVGLEKTLETEKKVVPQENFEAEKSKYLSSESCVTVDILNTSRKCSEIETIDRQKSAESLANKKPKEYNDVESINVEKFALNSIKNTATESIHKVKTINAEEPLENSSQNMSVEDCSDIETRKEKETANILTSKIPIEDCNKIETMNAEEPLEISMPNKDFDKIETMNEKEILESISNKLPIDYGSKFKTANAQEPPEALVITDDCNEAGTLNDEQPLENLINNIHIEDYNEVETLSKKEESMKNLTNNEMETITKATSNKSTSTNTAKDNCNTEQYVETKIIENFEQTPHKPNFSTAEIIAYVDEQNIVTSWTNENYNNLPIFIMETNLPNQFQETISPLMDSNIMQTTEVQHFIVMNNEDTLSNSTPILLVNPQSIVMNPMLELTQCDEFKAQNKTKILIENKPQKNNYVNEETTEKVYANLVNAFAEDTTNLSENLQEPKSDQTSLNITNQQTFTPNYQPNQFIQIENSSEVSTHSNYFSAHITQTAISNNLTTQPITSSLSPIQCDALNTYSDTETETETSDKLYGSEDLNTSFISEEATIFPAEFTQAITETIGNENYCDKRTFDIKSNSNISNMKSSIEMKTKKTTHNFIQNRVETTMEVPDSTTNKTPIEITEIQILKSVTASNIVELHAKNVGMLTRSAKAQESKIDSQNFEGENYINSQKPKITAKKRMPYTLTRLTEPQGHKLIELYRLNPQLWNPEHPNFASRRHKRISWRLLTTQFNATFYLNYNWMQVQRKMMDYIKYYRREQRRIKVKANVPKWPFFGELKFLDQVDVNNSGLQKRVQQRKEMLKIIEIYKAHPQLWDTAHSQYTKRNQRRCTIALMCSRLQELHNITIAPGKLKQCLLELRYNYRTTKFARIEAEKRNEAFEAASRFEFYSALQFLEPHLPPFNCEKCKIEFKCFSEFSVHCKKEHKQHQRSQYPMLANDIDNNTLDNVCHICGIKFTLRQNLTQHLMRHYCEKSLSCSTCEKKFFTKAALDEHERIHSRIPAVICPECGRTFYNTSKLNQHLKRHRNQRDYPCDQCDKAFYSAFDRERHVRRHLNIRDKICPVCGKSFVAGSSYYTHIKLHNDTKEYSCKDCKQEFAQYSGLYKHRKKYHS